MHPIALPLLLAFLASAIYAAALASPLGREVTASKTWITVVAGVSLVLGCIALYDAAMALEGLLFFVAGGVPIIVWQVAEEIRRERRIARRLMGD